MKKIKHPKVKQTTIIINDGSHIYVNWIFPKKKLKIGSDYLNSFLWQKNKKFFN